MKSILMILRFQKLRLNRFILRMAATNTSFHQWQGLNKSGKYAVEIKF